MNKAFIIFLFLTVCDLSFAQPFEDMAFCYYFEIVAGERVFSWTKIKIHQ